jgi:hypothetical protein
MGKSVIIDTPFPTFDEVADQLGLSKKRRKMMIDMVERSLSSSPTRKTTRAKTSTSVKSRSKANAAKSTAGKGAQAAD